MCPIPTYLPWSDSSLDAASTVSLLGTFLTLPPLVGGGAMSLLVMTFGLRSMEFPCWPWTLNLPWSIFGVMPATGPLILCEKEGLT